MRAAILMYHRVADNTVADRYTVSVYNFSRQMTWLAKSYEVVSLTTLLGNLSTSSSIQKEVAAITFDDGFKETYHWAVPVLKSLGLPAAFFFVTGLVGERSKWTKSNGSPGDHLMDWDEVKALANDGFEVGSHTRTHPVLTELERYQAEEEITLSKEDLESRLGIPVDFFAYPYGRYDSDISALVQKIGHRAACSTEPGFNNNTTDLFGLRRIEIMGGDSFRSFTRKVTFGVNEFGVADVLRYYVDRTKQRILSR